MYTVLASELGTEIVDLVEPITTAITTAVSATDVVGLLGKGVAFGIPFFLAIFGVRKIVQIAQSAIRNGNIRV